MTEAKPPTHFHGTPLHCSLYNRCLLQCFDFSSHNNPSKSRRVTRKVLLLAKINNCWKSLSTRLLGGHVGKQLSSYPSTDTIDRFLHNLIVNFIDFDSMNDSNRFKLWGYLIGNTCCIDYTICQRRSFWWHTLYNITTYELCAFGFCAFLGWR